MLQDADEVTLKVDVSVLKEKVNTLAVLCDKIDRVIEKLADLPRHGQKKRANRE